MSMQVLVIIYNYLLDYRLVSNRLVEFENGMGSCLPIWIHLEFLECTKVKKKTHMCALCTSTLSRART